MKTRFSILAAVAFAMTVPSIALAVEHLIPCSALPPGVLAKRKALMADGLVRGCVKDVTHGATTFEIEMTLKKGRTKGVTLDGTGSVLESEEEVERSALPASVEQALSKAAIGSRVGKIESAYRGGKVVSYDDHLASRSRGCLPA